MLQAYAMVSTRSKITVKNNTGESLPFNGVFRTEIRANLG